MTPPFWRRIPGNWKHLLRIITRRPEDDVDAELRFHFDERIAELTARGVPTPDARRQALEEFGDVDRVRERLQDIDRRLARRQRRTDWWEGVVQDIRFAVRGLKHNPGFTAAAILTFGLGLGANATIFSLIDRTLVRGPAGVSSPSQIKRLYRRGTEGGRALRTTSAFSYPEVRDIRASISPSLPLAGYFQPDARPAQSACVGGRLIQVVGDYFGVLALRPAVGRFFTADEARVENPTPIAVISYSCWKSQFAGDPAVLGKTVEVANRQFTIIGVAPKGFGGTDLGQDDAEAWAPAGVLAPPNTGPNGPWYESAFPREIRLLFRPASLSEARRLQDAATRVIREARGGMLVDTTGTAFIVDLQARVMPEAGNAEVAISTRLAGVALIILLIACANVTNLLLARGVARRREFAVRLALGVGRTRLIRLLMIESSLLALGGGVAALVVGVGGGSVLREALFSNLNWSEPVIDLRLSIVVAVLAMLAGCGAGLLPALHAVRADMTSEFTASVRTGSVRKSRVRNTLLVLQTALSVVLLAGAALFVRSLQNVEATKIGYDANRLVLAAIPSRVGSGSADTTTTARLPEIEAQLAKTPGVERVAEVQFPPLLGLAQYHVFLPDRDSIASLGVRQSVMLSPVSPDYFRVVGIQVKQGRGIAATDEAHSELVVAISASLAKLLWPGESPLNKCIIVGSRSSVCRRVVGVVTEAHILKILEPDREHLYVPLAQLSGASVRGLVIRVSPERVPAVVSAAQRLLTDPVKGRLSPPLVKSMSDVLAPELHPWRLGAALFSTAGILALLVALVGIIGSVSYTVGQRRHEMGIRAALGAGAPAILQLVVGEGLQVVAAGVLLGVALALALGKLVTSMLHDVSPRDPLVLASVSVGFLLIAAAACMLPAWSATRVDPTEALRAE